MSDPENPRLRTAVKRALTGSETTVDLCDLGANRTLVLANGRFAPGEPCACVVALEAHAVSPADDSDAAQ
jgi:hypothetical protein